MANFNGTILTNLGKQAIAQSLTGKQFEITKVVLGDGVWDENTNPEELTNLISPKLALPIAGKEENGDTVRIRVLLTNEGVTEGFFIRELGVIAEDKTTGEEILYAVAYADPPDFLPSENSSTKVEAGFDVIVVVANSPNITVRVSDTIVLATKQDIQTHNQSPEAHPDIRQAIQNLEEQISNLGEGITPDIQNAIEQHNQDPDAHPELLLKFVWRKDTRNPTPDDVPPYENALWLNLESGEIFLHLKNCNGKAFWKGQLGTLITPLLVNVFDIFGDGSAVALYRFDGNANDDGGQYNGTWYGTEQYDIGKFGQAAKFDGNSWIKLGNEIRDVIDSKVFTVSGWVNWSAFNSWSRFIDINGNFLIANRGETNTLAVHFRLNDDYSGKAIELENFLELNMWYFIAVSVDFINNYYKLFINGNFINTSTNLGPDTPDAPVTALGKSSWSQDSLFRGLIDQVRIFNRALTDEEIQVLYNEEVNC